MAEGNLFTGFRVADNYVFYERLRESKGHWKNTLKRAEAELNTIPNLFDSVSDKLDEVANYLINIGQQEQAKEISLIEDKVGDLIDRSIIEEAKNGDYRNFIQALNEVLMGKKRFEDMLRVLNNYINSIEKTQEERRKKDPNYRRKDRSAMISSYFGSYLINGIEQNVNKFQQYVRDNIIDLDSQDWENAFNKYVIDPAVDEMVKEMNNAQEKYAGDEQVWQGLEEVYNTFQSFQGGLRDLIRKQVDFDSLRKELKEKSSSTKKGYGYISRKNVTSKMIIEEKNSRTIGGLIYEYVNSAFKKIVVTEKGSYIYSDRGGDVLESNMARTDSLQIISSTSEIDLNEVDQIMKELNEHLLGSTSLEETRRRLQEFYNNRLSKLNKDFLVYTSAKSYALTDAFRGFSGGTKQTLSEIPTYLSQVGIDENRAKLFISKVYSTISGGLIDDKQDSYKEELRIGLTQAMAYLLFDDWKQIGNEAGDNSSIHLFALNGIQVPLSYLLIASGKAIQEVKVRPTGFFQAHISLPQNILYPTPIQAKSVGEVEAKWEEQRNYALKNSTFSIHFLSNFKDLIKGF